MNVRRRRPRTRAFIVDQQHNTHRHDVKTLRVDDKIKYSNKLLESQNGLMVVWPDFMFDTTFIAAAAGYRTTNNQLTIGYLVVCGATDFHRIETDCMYCVSKFSNCAYLDMARHSRDNISHVFQQAHPKYPIQR